MTRRSFAKVLGFVLTLFLLLPLPVLTWQLEPDLQDSTRILRNRIYPLPILFYTPETGIAGGAAALYLIRDSSSIRPSNVTADAIYTQQKQIILELDGDLYFSNDTYRLLSSIAFQKYPDKFFGIGNFTALSNEETYTPESFAVRAVLYWKFFSKYSLGPILRYESVSMHDVLSSGLLAPGVIAGSKGSRLSGIGLVANWDSRDNTFAASSGSFYQVTGLLYDRSLGSEYNYRDVQIDARQFFELIPEQVIAIQETAEFTDGTVPFQDLVRFGGQNIVRGYYDGRYRDNNGIAVQGEYHLPVWWKFGVVGFAGIGQVANEIDDIAVNRFWFAGGMGLRFFWSRQEHISLRLDYGIGNNSSGVYITVTEAF